MYKTDIIYDDNHIEYRIEYAFQYNIPYSSPVIINVFRHDKDKKGHPKSSKHVLHIIINQKDNFETYQKFVDVIPVEILEQIREKINKIFNWRDNFNRFLENYKWFIQEENQINAQAFTIYYNLNYNNIQVKCGWNDTKNKVIVNEDDVDKTTIHVTVHYDFILIIIEDFDLPIFVSIYPDKIKIYNIFETKEIYKFNLDKILDTIKEMSKFDESKIKDEFGQAIKNKIEELTK